MEIGIEFAVGQVAKRHESLNIQELNCVFYIVFPSIPQTQGGMKNYAMASHHLKLPQGILVRAGLADLFIIQSRHLVASNHQGTRKFVDNGTRFFTGKPQCGLFSCFV